MMLHFVLSRAPRLRASRAAPRGGRLGRSDRFRAGDINSFLPDVVNIDAIQVESSPAYTSFSFRSDAAVLDVTINFAYGLEWFAVTADSYGSVSITTASDLISAIFNGSDGSVDAADVTVTNNPELCCDDVTALSSAWTPPDGSACTATCNACPTGYVGPTCSRCECVDSCTDDGLRTGSPTNCDCVASADNNVEAVCEDTNIVTDPVTLASAAFNGGVQLITYESTEGEDFPECTVSGAMVYTRACHKLMVCVDSAWVELADRPVWAV